MTWPDMLRSIHVAGATVLLVGGLAIVFFTLRAHRTRDPIVISRIAKRVVFAIWLVTAISVISQPISGVILAIAVDWPLAQGWLAVAIGLYITAGVFWIPLVWAQHRLGGIAREAAVHGAALLDAYFRFFRIWLASGFPAFSAVIAIIWLMVARPAWL